MRAPQAVSTTPLSHCTIASLLPIDYYNAVANHRFTLCPWGNGLDTHRLYEGTNEYDTTHPTSLTHSLTPSCAVLVLGSIPVVKRSSINSCLDSTDDNLTVTVVNKDGSERSDVVTRGSIPVVIVSKWSEVTSALLESRWADFFTPPHSNNATTSLTHNSEGVEHWDYSRVTMHHWATRILGHDYENRTVPLDEITYMP